ncbi:MAG: HAD-IA family hydrolase [Maritimibacter sp.]|nr:HAD-IA family hydrolase [Maritimibacter sp.]
MAIRLVAWDFDGVLNRTETDFDRVARDFDAALGLSFRSFVDFHFSGARLADVLTGARRIEELFAAWLAREGSAVSVERLVDWWLSANHRPDEDMIRLSGRLPQRQIIATNNETRRADHIRTVAGWAARVDRVFASGEMGVAKPDAGFFARIEDWAAARGELAPAEILFVDDSTDNIRAAAARGWQVFHFTDETRDQLPAHLDL